MNKQLERKYKKEGRGLTAAGAQRVAEMEKAAILLAAAVPQKEVAKHMGIPLSDLKDIVKVPEFMESFESALTLVGKELVNEVVAETKEKMDGLMNDAVSSLKKILKDKDAKDADKIRAAIYVLDAGLGPAKTVPVSVNNDNRSVNTYNFSDKQKAAIDKAIAELK